MAFLDELAPYGGRVCVYPEDEAGLIPVGSSRVRASQRRPHLQLRAWAVARRGGGRHGALAAGQPAHRTLRGQAGGGWGGPLEAFEVVCQRSGVTLKIGSGPPILDAAEEAGLKVLSSCRAGVCGTCDVDVSGAHRTTVTRCSRQMSGNPTNSC